MYSWPSSCSSVSSSSGQWECNSVEMDAQKCPMCTDDAPNRHFSAICCNSCAAFFRRTIKNKRAYVCLNGKNCKITMHEQRHMCKYCRFQLCIRAGLNISMAINRISQDKNELLLCKSTLEQLVSHQQETFLHRFQAAIEVQDGRCDRVWMGLENPSFLDTINSVRGEYVVLNKYLKASGFSTLGLNSEQIESLSRSIFYSWLVFSSVTSTARNSGFRHNKVYFVDENSIKVEGEQLLNYHSSCPNLMDATQCARIALALFNDVLTVAQKLHSARLDEVEVAVMFQIIALKGAQRLFIEKDEAVRMELNQLFKCLRDYFESKFDDTSIRMGQLILLTDEIESLTRAFNEYVLILQLNGYSTVLSSLVNAPNMWTYA
ncbi:Nuclear receptor subfamily 5 group A member 2-like protein [Aphelenchoides bicaudatus]|nr:Nuclear receptor subfamily 5 group A member 2-like protein [Aphelenchoides bicaudatus]